MLSKGKKGREISMKVPQINEYSLTKQILICKTNSKCEK